MGADPHPRDSEGLTPADLAEESGYHACAEFLRNCEPISLPKIEVNKIFSLPIKVTSCCFQFSLADTDVSKSSLTHLTSEKPMTPKTAPKPAPISPAKQLKNPKTRSSVTSTSSNTTSSAGLVKKSMTTTQLGNINRQRVNNTGDENAELKGMFMKMKQSRAALLTEEETSRIKLDINEEEEEDTSGMRQSLIALLLIYYL